MWSGIRGEGKGRWGKGRRGKGKGCVEKYKDGYWTEEREGRRARERDET